MRNVFRTLYILPLLLIALMAAACSAPEETNSNEAAAAPATQNANQTPTTVNTSPVTVEPQPTATLPPPKPAEPAANGKAAFNLPGNVREPKLVVPKTVIDFGAQAKEKSLARSFVIKNEGSAELKIDAVEPS